MIQQVFKDFPATGYDFPLRSLNSASFQDFPSPEIMGDNSVLLLMSDGLIMLFESTGLGTDALVAYIALHPCGAAILLQTWSTLPRLLSASVTARWTIPAIMVPPNHRAAAFAFAT
jgi:hypothetical protein